MTDAIAMFGAGIAALALVVAAAAARYSYLQTRAALRQATAAEETVRLQAEALKVQAQDTAKALEIAERSAEAAQASALNAEIMLQSRRAWVVVKDWTSTRASRTVEPLNGRIWFVNSGESPALDVKISHTFRILKQFDEDKVDYDDYFEPSHGVLGPNVSVDKFIEFKYNEEQSIEAVQEEHVTVFWYGIVTYGDIFGKERLTKFCFEYDVKKQKFELCLLHNSPPDLTGRCRESSLTPDRPTSKSSDRMRNPSESECDSNIPGAKPE